MTIPKSRSGLLKYLITCAGLAPSSHNTQPWNFSLDQNSIKVWADFSRRLPIGDPQDRELYTSIGAAIQNILSASQELGIKAVLQLFPAQTESELVAEIGLQFPPKLKPKLNREYLSAIHTRRTNRTPYDPTRPLSRLVSKKISQIALDHGGELILITERKVISQLADMVKSGMIAFLQKSDFRQELSGWIRHDWSKKGDGLPGYSIGMPGIVSIIAPVLIKSTGPIKEVAEGEKRAVESCSNLGIIKIPKDTKLWWVKTGMIFENIALFLETKGLSTAILTSIVESPIERKKLKSIIHGEPALFFRLGYATGPGIEVPRRTHVTI